MCVLKIDAYSNIAISQSKTILNVVVEFIKIFVRGRFYFPLRERRLLLLLPPPSATARDHSQRNSRVFPPRPCYALKSFDDPGRVRCATRHFMLGNRRPALAEVCLSLVYEPKIFRSRSLHPRTEDEKERLREACGPAGMDLYRARGRRINAVDF